MMGILIGEMVWFVLFFGNLRSALRGSSGIDLGGEPYRSGPMKVPAVAGMFVFGSVFWGVAGYFIFSVTNH